MGNLLVFDANNFEVRSVWSSFAGRSVDDIVLDVGEGTQVVSGTKLGTVQWSSGDSDSLVAPAKCNGRIARVRIRKTDYGRLGVRPSIVFFDMDLGAIGPEIGEPPPGKSKTPKGAKPTGRKPKGEEPAGEKGEPAKGGKKPAKDKVESTPAKGQSKRTSSRRKTPSEPSTN